MVAITFQQLLSQPALAKLFNPLADVLELGVSATEVQIKNATGGTAFITAAGTVVLPIDRAQIVSNGGAGDNIKTTKGMIVIGDGTKGAKLDGAANAHTAKTAAGDQFQGLGGNDSFTGNAGADIAYGNHGTDRLLGAAGNDTLYGGQNDGGVEVLSGGLGNDLIYGNLGMDLISGDDGHDHLYGGQGVDTLKGGSGNDYLAGNRDQDAIYGNKGDDTLKGGPDGDVLYGGQGMDLVDGGSGDDKIYGNLDGDILKGGTGADTLFGGRGADLLHGGVGDDVLLGNKGADTLVGGTGDDVYVLTPGDGADVTVIRDFEPGIDQMDLRNVNVVIGGLDQEGPHVRVTLTSGDQILFQNSIRADIAAVMQPFLEPGDIIDGTSGADSLVGTSRFDTISGFDGNDTILGLEGDDLLIGGAGNDLLDAGTGDGADILYGGIGDDSFLGAGWFYGEEGDDVFGLSGTEPKYWHGGPGNDVFGAGGHSFGLIIGGSGADTIHAGWGTAYYQFGRTMNSYPSSAATGKDGQPDVLYITDPRVFSNFHFQHNSIVDFEGGIDKIVIDWDKAIRPLFPNLSHVALTDVKSYHPTYTWSMTNRYILATKYNKTSIHPDVKTYDDFTISHSPLNPYVGSTVSMRSAANLDIFVDSVLMFATLANWSHYASGDIRAIRSDGFAIIRAINSNATPSIDRISILYTFGHVGADGFVATNDIIII